MSLIKLWERSRVRVDKFVRFANGDNKDYAPISPIKQLSIWSMKVVRLVRFERGNNRD